MKSSIHPEIAMTYRPIADPNELKARYGRLHDQLTREHAAAVPDQVAIDRLIRQLDDLQGQLKAADGQPGNNPLSNRSNPG
jgi:hypothetical protein